MSARVLEAPSFDTLIPLLHDRSYTVVGPTIHEGTIAYGVLDTADDFPIGWTDEQEAGTYRIRPSDDDAYFGYTVGPRTLKRYLFPSEQTLLTIEHAETGLSFNPEPLPDARYAFIGVRACELAGVSIQDTVFGGPPFADAAYQTRRANSFTVAVNCSVAGATCFCDSMGTGPRCTQGYDLVVTELIDDTSHEFLVEAGSEDGESVLTQLPGREVTDGDRAAVDAQIAETISHMGRTMHADATKDLLAENLEHPIWDSIAERCLSCTNCTLVCPTCFCSTVEDVTDLEGKAVCRRRWDACFNREFTYLHGHPVRYTTRSRYRQWITHKLSWWYDQFGTSGCVGCGRCITWCPAGIDITEEIQRLEAQMEAGV